MAELLVKFTEPLRGSDGRSYDAQACGDIGEDGLWQGWLEFRSGNVMVRSGRETEQPNLADLQYWAQGLTMVYLEGALERARGGPVMEPVVTDTGAPVFDRPASHPAPPRVVSARPVLNPFLVYAEGEALLVQQLQALSRDSLAAIIEWYNLPVSVDPRTSPAAAIAEDIVRTLREARRHSRSAGTERRAS